jgi:U3 small nucleolar RNA-associated protein 20
VLRARAAAVAHVALQRLLDHTRRGGAGPLWDALLTTATARLAAADAAAAAAGHAGAANGGGPAGAPDADAMDEDAPAAGPGLAADAAAAAEASAARGVLHLAQAVAFFRGSRVEDFGPVLCVCDALVRRMARSGDGGGPWEGGGGAGGDGGVAQWALVEEASEVPPPPAYASPRLPAAALQLLLAVAHGHLKAVGASGGLSALARSAPAWAPAFGARGVAPDDLLRFARGLVFPPGDGASELAEVFAPQLLGALGRVALPAAVAGKGGSGGAAEEEDGEAAGELQDRALLLLADACDVLRPGAAAGQGLPLLLTAQPGGAALAAGVRRLAGDWAPAAGHAGGGSGAAARRRLLRCWAGLQLLPHACERAAAALEICGRVTETVDAAIAALAAEEKAAQQPEQAAAAAAITDLLQLRAAAAATLVRVLPAAAPAALPGAAAAALALALRHPEDFATVDAAAQMLGALRELVDSGSDPGGEDGGGGEAAALAAFRGDAAALGAARRQLSLAAFEPAAAALALALCAASQPLRGAALRALTSFDQPPYAAGKVDADSAAAARGQAPAFTGVRCEALEALRDMHEQRATLERGRKWAVALGRMQNHIEYGRMPAVLLKPLLGALIGVSHIRFQPLWAPAAEAMGTALGTHEAAAWPLLLAQLRRTQAAFLEGGGGGGGARRRGGGGDGGGDGGEPGETLAARFAWAVARGGVTRGGGATDEGVRLGWLLKAASKAPSEVLERGGRDWVPLFLDYAAVGRRLHGDVDAEGEEEDDGEGAAAGAAADEATDAEDGDGSPASAGAKRKRGDGGGCGGGSAPGVGGKAWRQQMLEWLGLLGAVKGARSLFRCGGGRLWVGATGVTRQAQADAINVLWRRASPAAPSPPPLRAPGRPRSSAPRRSSCCPPTRRCRPQRSSACAPSGCRTCQARCCSGCCGWRTMPRCGRSSWACRWRRAQRAACRTSTARVGPVGRCR